MHAAPLTIARLHAHAGTHEPLIARMAAEALAAEVAAALPPLPPQAVLMLRRLALALPLRALERLPDARLRLQVASAARGAIADAAAHAGRPALGPVADDAEAVWFGDEAELLACLARDALAGRLDHWWWRQLLGRAHPDWVSAWVDRPAMAAAALRLLARTGQLAAVRTVLAPRGVLALLPAAPDTVPVHAARTPRADLAAAVSPQLISVPAMPAKVQCAGDAVPATRFDDDPAVAAAQPVAPDDAIATLVAPATDVPAPARPLARAPGAQPTQKASPVADLATERTAVAPPDIPADAMPEPKHAVEPAPAHTTARADPVVPSIDAGLALQAATGHDNAAPPAPMPVKTLVRHATAPTRAHLATAPVARPRGAPGAVASPALLPPAAVDVPIQAPAAGLAATLDAAPHVVITHYGRLMFLVNLLLGDGLYPDFTRPLDPAFPLSVWRLLMLLGHGLIGPALRDDPLWNLLEALAADGAQAGPVRDLERRWPVPKPPAVRRLPGPANVRSPHPRRLRHAPAGSLARWLACYLASVRARLAPALATTPALDGRTFAGPAAQLWVSEAELVLVTPLDTHPVAWRLAGLDRDPGPLPGAGRTLRLVFD